MSGLPDALPVGSILSFAVDTLPPGYSDVWRLCHGGQLSKVDFPDLFRVIGYTYGSDVNDDKIFHLPNLQGYFLRGVDETGKVDVDADKRRSVKDAPAPFL